MNNTITISQLRPKHGNGLSESNITIKEGEKWCIGTLEEMLMDKRMFVYEMKRANWIIGDYYDHLWYIWGRTSKTSEESVLKLVRTTDAKYSDDVIGIMEEKRMLKEKEEYRSALMNGNFDDSSIRGDYKESIVHCKAREIQLCNGRGDSDWDIYLRINKEGKVTAFAIIGQDTLKYILDQ